MKRMLKTSWILPLVLGLAWSVNADVNVSMDNVTTPLGVAEVTVPLYLDVTGAETVNNGTILIQYNTADLLFDKAKSAVVNDAVSVVATFNEAAGVIQFVIFTTSGGLTAASNPHVANLVFDVLMTDAKVSPLTYVLDPPVIGGHTVNATTGSVELVKIFNAAADTATVDEDSTVNIDVLLNDFDDQGTTPVPGSFVTAVGPAGGLLGPANGTAVIVNNQIQYTPDPDYFGTDTFEYSAQDPAGNPDAGTVTVTVTPVNDPPVVALTWNGANLPAGGTVVTAEGLQPAFGYVVHDIDSDTVAVSVDILGQQIDLVDQGTVAGAKVSGVYNLPPIPYDTVQHPLASVDLAALVSADDGAVRAVVTVPFTVRVEDVDQLPDAPAIGINPAAPKTLDPLTAVILTPAVDPDGDAVTYDYTWTRTNPAGPVVSGAVLPASQTAKGEQWTLEVKALTEPYGDGNLAAGPVATQNVTIVNTAPDRKTPPVSTDYTYSKTVLSVNVPGFEEQTLNLASLVSDPDGDVVDYQLEPGGQVLDLAGFTLDNPTGLVTFTPNDKGDNDEYSTQFSFMATDADDATLPQVITVILNFVDNQLPVVVSVSPSVAGDATQAEDPTTDEVDANEAPSTVAFSATFSDATDPQHFGNADAFDYITRVEWYLDEQLVKTDTPPPAAARAAFSGNYVFETAGFDEIVNDAGGQRPQSITRTVQAVAYDDLDGSTTVTWIVTINDVDRDAPAPVITITPAGPLTTDDLTAAVETAPVDPDGDAILGYVGQWGEVTRLVEGPAQELVLNSSETSKGDTWEVSMAAVTDPYVGVPARVQVTSANVGTAQVTILNTEPEAVSQTVADETAVTVLEDQQVQITLQGLDADADDEIDDLQFTVGTPANGSLSAPVKVDRTSATVTYTPDDNWNGTDSFTFTVSDGAGNPVRGESAAATVEIVVTPVNDCPSFVGGAAVFGLEPGAAVAEAWASGFVAGPNEAEQALAQYLVTVGDASLFAVQPAVALDGTLSFTLAAAAPRGASTVVEVVAQDDAGTANGGCDLSAAESFTVTVNSPPTAPAIEVVDGNPADAVYTTDDLVCNVTTEAVDADGINGDPLEYMYSWTDGATRIELQNNGWTTALSDTLPAALTMRGTITCTVTARDGLGATADPVAEQIEVVNRPPMLAVAPAIVVDGDSPETTSTFSVNNLQAVIDGRDDADEDDGATTPDPSILYQWQKRAAGDWEDLGGQTSETLPPGLLEDGESVRLQVTAIDDLGALSVEVYSNILTVGSAPWFPIFTLQPQVSRNGMYLDEDAWYRVTIISDASGEVVMTTNIYGTKMEPIEYFKAGSTGLLPGDYTVRFQVFNPAVGQTVGEIGSMGISVQYEPAGQPVAVGVSGNTRGQLYTYTFTTPNARGYVFELYRSDAVPARGAEELGGEKRVFRNVYLPNEETGVLPVGGEQTLSVELADQGVYSARVMGFNPLDEEGDQRVVGPYWASFEPIVIGSALPQDAPEEPISGFYPDGELIVTPNPSTDLLLQWQPVPGATSYKVYLAAAGQAAILNFHNVGDATSWQLSDLPVGSYGWQVVAVNAAGASERSRPLVFDIVNDATTPVVREVMLAGGVPRERIVAADDTLFLVYAPGSVLGTGFNVMFFSEAAGNFLTYNSSQVEVLDGGNAVRVPGASFVAGDYVLIQAFGEHNTVSAYKVYVIKGEPQLLDR